MADRLLIILVNTDPQDPVALGSSLQQATCAAAMEYEVEVVLSGRSSELALKGVAASVQAPGGKSAYDLIRDAHESGVRFKASGIDKTPADELIPEVTETVGGAYLISEAMDEDTVTLTY